MRKSIPAVEMTKSDLSQPSSMNVPIIQQDGTARMVTGLGAEYFQVGVAENEDGLKVAVISMAVGDGAIFNLLEMDTVRALGNKLLKLAEYLESGTTDELFEGAKEVEIKDGR